MKINSYPLCCKIKILSDFGGTRDNVRKKEDLIAHMQEQYDWLIEESYDEGLSEVLAIAAVLSTQKKTIKFLEKKDFYRKETITNIYENEDSIVYFYTKLIYVDDEYDAL